MRLWIRLFVCGVVASGIALAEAKEPARLKILYAGHPESERERDYVGFLKETFAQVDAVDYRAFREEMADGHDVVIFDWTSISPRNAAGRVDYESSKGEMNDPEPIPRLSEDFSRPTILIGTPGELVVDRLRLKIDWGCRCLSDHAHGMKTSHLIFRDPFPLDLRLEEIPTPPDYNSPLGGKPVGPTIQAWRVQTRRFFDDDPGMVARGDDFEEAPDAEVISSGTNSKGPDMVALGRQGNYFLWGFAAPPSEMTPEGRKCFLNVVHYIKRFDGQKPVVRKPEGRIVTRKLVRRVAEQAPIIHDPDGLRRSSPVYASYDPLKYQAIRRMELRTHPKYFPAEVNQQGAINPGAYLAWFEANERWLVPGGTDEFDGIRAIAVDEDLKALALGNREVATLDACVGMLATGDRAELARRVLNRYTGQDFADVEGWRRWLDTYRDRLVFTEVGGFRFVVADSAAAVRPEGDERLPLNPPGPARKLFEPVKLAGSVDPARASVGQVVTVSFRLEIAARWHVAAQAGPAGPESPIFLELALPAGLEPVGEWVLPEPTFDAGGHGRHEGLAEFRHQVRVTAAASGKLTITPSAYYQACDPASCRPPVRGVVDVPLEVVAP